MRLFKLVILFTIISNFSKAQDSLQILGKWKVVAVNNGVKYDYKKESYSVDKSLSNSLQGRWDSSKVIRNFLNWARSCPNCIYVFGPENIYQEYREEDLRSDGTFKLRSNTKQIEVAFLKDNVTKHANYKFNFINENLVLYVPSFFISGDIELLLERVK